MIKVELIEHCASDLAVVNAARVSFAQHKDLMEESDQKLLSYLLRNSHGTPFEHGYFRFRVEAPIFVFREWHRHRIGHSYNEMSGRYTELEERFWYPKQWRMQIGKPGAYEYVAFDGNDTDAFKCIDQAYETSWRSYKNLINMGVAKEQARAVLPLGIFSQMYWSCNPRSLMHFLGLRNASDAQEEIREAAIQAEEHFVRIMPVTHNAFVTNSRKAP